MIPKIIHLVWIGGTAMPQKYSDWSQSWQVHNPQWEVRVWDDAAVAALRPFAAQSLYDGASNLAEKFDIVRLEILRRYGGLSCDCDILCLRPIPEFISQAQAFISYQAPGFGCCSVMGGVPNHPFFQTAVDCLAGWRLKQLPRDPNFKSLYVDSIRLKLFPQLPVFNQDVFNPPLQFDAEENLLTDAGSYPHSVTLHSWDHTGR